MRKSVGVLLIVATVMIIAASMNGCYITSSPDLKQGNAWLVDDNGKVIGTVTAWYWRESTGIYVAVKRNERGEIILFKPE